MGATVAVTVGNGELGVGGLTLMVACVWMRACTWRSCCVLASVRSGDFSGRKGRVAAATNGVANGDAIVLGVAGAGRDEMGVNGVSGSRVTGRWRTGLFRKAGCAFSEVGDETDPVGDVAERSGIERAGEVGAVEWALGLTDSSSPTTSQPSTACSEAEDESDDSVLEERLAVEPIVVPGTVCERP